MQINIIAVGKIKEKYLRDAIEEYSKRLSRFCDLHIYELDDEKINTENDANIEKAKSKEKERIFKIIEKEKMYIVALDIKGKEYTTEEFTEKMVDIKNKGCANISFIIGGSYGLDNNVLDRADMRLSFSKMTFPHQLFRVILLEQIYRAFKIENNEPYHK